MGNPDMKHLELLVTIAKQDVEVLLEKEKSYGGSWKIRGGQGAYFVSARKWDRLENWIKQPRGGAPAWDIFEHARLDTRPESILDDIADLRRYLLLIEAEVRARVAGGSVYYKTREAQTPPTQQELSHRQKSTAAALAAALAAAPAAVQVAAPAADTNRRVPRFDHTGQSNPHGFDPKQDIL